MAHQQDAGLLRLRTCPQHLPRRILGTDVLGNAEVSGAHLACISRVSTPGQVMAGLAHTERIGGRRGCALQDAWTARIW
jgi:hypothetical protein